MLRLRRAATADGAAIHATHVASIRTGCRTHYAAEDIEAWAGRSTPAAHVAELERCDVVVGENDEGVVGFGVLDAGRSEVRAVYVHPDAGRRGVGRRLLAALEAIARLRGSTELRLDASLNAVPFYGAAGWRRVCDTLRTFPGGHDIPCVAMTKSLLELRLTVRGETPDDASAIRAVERVAFVRPDEAALVDRLRAEHALAQSLVATLDGAVVGHLALSPVEVGASAARVLGLGPVAVEPAYQRCGLGARLVEEGLARARAAGIAAVVVLGDPSYYARFGFIPARHAGIRYDDSAESAEAFMLAELVPGGLAGATGRAHYHPAFDAV
jgi:putative acetyltransferase